MDSVRKEFMSNLGFSEKEQQFVADAMDRYIKNRISNPELIGDKLDEYIEGQSSSNAKRLKKAIIAEYKLNQEKLKQEHPGGVVTLYRGTGEKINDKDFDDVPKDSLSSWSENKDTARFFASFKDENLIKVEVPIETVFASHRTRSDFSKAKQSEYVVMS